MRRKPNHLIGKIGSGQHLGQQSDMLRQTEPHSRYANKKAQPEPGSSCSGVTEKSPASRRGSRLKKRCVGLLDAELDQLFVHECNPASEGADDMIADLGSRKGDLPLKVLRTWLSNDQCRPISLCRPRDTRR
jgi:hypothetical protein